MSRVEVKGRCVAIEDPGDGDIEVTLLIEAGRFAGGRLKLRPSNHDGPEPCDPFILGKVYDGQVTLP